MARPTKSTVSELVAKCEECGWTSIDKNGLGLAARHHDHSGHRVRTLQTIEVIYGTEPDLEAMGQTTLDDTL